MIYGTDTTKGVERISHIGNKFLKDLGVENPITLTQKQIHEILSIQERLEKTDNNRWKIVDTIGVKTFRKKRQGGHLDFEKWKTRFFTSTK